MKKTFALLAVAAMALSGCTSNYLVPKTTIAIKGDNGRSYKLQLPKDMSASNISLTIGTNGLPLFSVTDIKVRMNPEVIGAAGTAQADTINAAGNVMMQAFQMGFQAAKAAAK